MTSVTRRCFRTRLGNPRKIPLGKTLLGKTPLDKIRLGKIRRTRDRIRRVG